MNRCDRRTSWSILLVGFLLSFAFDVRFAWSDTLVLVLNSGVQIVGQLQKARGAESDQERQREGEERKWFVELKRLRKMLQSQRAAEARQQILEIRDPHAVRALSENLRTETNRSVKSLYIKALGGIGNRDALVTLIHISLTTPDVELFNECVDQVVRLQNPEAISVYTRGLQDANNIRVNRSARALEQIGDQRAVEPLIRALITTHHVLVNREKTIVSRVGGNATSGGSPHGESAGHQTIGSVGGELSGEIILRSREVVPVQMCNADVLAALVKLTGVNSIGYDQKAWQNWYALQSKQLQNGATAAKQ